MAVYYPDAPPPTLFDLDGGGEAVRGAELVAPRDFNPFAWVERVPPRVLPVDARDGHRARVARASTAVSAARYFAPIRVGDVITCVATLVDAYEKDGKLGTMLFLVDESRWTNQRGELVKLGLRTSIYH